MCERRFEGKEHAAAYLRHRVLPHEVVAKIVDFMKGKRGEPFNLAVDVGCGSGQGTILLAPHFTQVVGMDVSPAQLEMALANSNPPNVSYRQCPAEELPFADGEVDLVSAMTAAHWFDRPRFLREADRVLRPGGCLALLSYGMEMELEYGDISGTLNDICKECYAVLQPYHGAYIRSRLLQAGTSTPLPIYKDMYDSCPYPDKEWNECLRVRRPMPLTGYIGMVETFSCYQKLLEKDPDEAQRLSNDVKSKLLTAMGVSSPDTEVVVVVQYWYWLAHKP